MDKNEIKSLEEKQQKDNTARQMDIAKLDGKLDTENGARKAEIAALDSWAKGENDARKTAIANLENFAKSENDGRKADIAALNKRADDEASARGAEDAALNERISKEISDRENSNQDLQNRMDAHNSDRISDIEDLKLRIERENAFLKSLQGKTLGVSFNAYRTKAYDGGGEENLTFQGTYCNNGGGLDTDTGIFTCPSVRTVRRLPPSSTRTIRTTTRTPWPDRTSSLTLSAETRSWFTPTPAPGWPTSP